MEKIIELTKLTLSELKNKNTPITPENYFKEFKIQSILKNIEIEEFNKFDNLLTNLTQKERKSQRINSYYDLIEVLLQRIPQEELENFTKNIEKILSPSINFNYDEKTEKYVKKISKDPQKLLKNKSIEEMISITDDRVSKDRKVLREKTDDVVKLTSLMEKYFDKTLLESDDSSKEIHNIKNELTQLNISNASHRELGLVQKKLVDTIYNIETNMKNSKKELNVNKEKFKELHEQIEDLQKELVVLKEEKSTDFLTGVLNRRAFKEEVAKTEKRHQIFGAKYAIVFYDIDHFKEINDTHGHVCGDAVLKAFGRILKGLTRKEDVIARYGGEEFVALVNYEDEKELERYVKRVRVLIENSDFLYKEIKIDVKFSAGVSLRNKYKSYSEAKSKADELLYKAKHEGRDKIIFDNGKVL